jgi:hypothetical protein
MYAILNIEERAHVFGTELAGRWGHARTFFWTRTRSIALETTEHNAPEAAASSISDAPISRYTQEYTGGTEYTAYVLAEYDVESAGFRVSTMRLAVPLPADNAGQQYADPALLEVPEDPGTAIATLDT